MTGDVHGDHRRRPLADRRLGRRRVDAARVRVDVDEHRNRVDHQDGSRRGHERPRGDDHLVAGADAEGQEGHLEGVGAVGDGDRRVGALQSAPS